MSRDRSLPIFDLEVDLARAASAEGRVRIVIEAPTGSGKSTQVPQMLLDSGACGEVGEIVVLEPRRLAARMLSRRVAWERGVEVGGEVGCQVRFENRTSRSTRIRYVTEGVLLRQLLRDPNLNGVAAVVFDEFHERHFYGDVSLARCVEVQESRRPDLKLVVMSATLQIESLNRYLGADTRHLISEGRTFPVEISYHPSRERHGGATWDHVVRTLHAYYKKHGVDGHALVFLPGVHEIRKTVDLLRKANWARGFEIHSLYGELSPQAQDAAVNPSQIPKIVVATNVAETSITIDGVRLVVDSGLERRSNFDVRRGIATLTIEKISRASADQRAGRAGRTGPGHCLRLWSENDHAARDEATPAEIHRMDLDEAVLVLKAGGIDDVRGFHWFEAPGKEALDRAHTSLVSLGAIDPDDETLTPLGRDLSRLPLSPRYARVLLEAAQQGFLEYFAVVAAATQARPLFPNRKSQASDLELADFVEEGDASDFQALYRAWSSARGTGYDFDICRRMGINVNASREIGKVARQFADTVRPLVDREDQDAEPDAETIGRILISGFSDRVCVRLSEATLACAMVGGRRGLVEKGCAASSRDVRLFLAGEVVEIEGREVSVKMGKTTRIEEAWIRERFPSDFHDRAGAAWEESTRRVVARQEKRFRDLVLEARQRGEVPPGEAAEILAEQVAAGNLVLKKWDQDVEQWIARVNTLSAFFPEYEITPIGEEERRLLLTQVCEGALGYKQIKDRPVKPVLEEWLPAHQAGLIDRLAPERVRLSSGRGAKVIYDVGGGRPKISVMIQHLFGVSETPTIADGRIPLVVEILAPNSRPCQTTEDLAGFWSGSYAAVRAQLRGRYPKHDWPEPDES